MMFIFLCKQLETMNITQLNYEDFGFSETEDPNILNSEIALFLSTQSRAEKLEIYRDFMTSYGVIEDLMCLDIDERLEVVMELGVYN